MAEESKGKKFDEDREELAKENAMALMPFAVVALVLIVVLFAFGFIFQSGPQDQRCANAMMPEWRDSCFSNLAQATDNSSYCGRIAESNRRDLCLAATKAGCESYSAGMLRDSCYIGQNTTFGCSQLSSNQSKNECYYEVAVASDNASACYGISDNLTKYSCSNQIWEKLAQKSGNASLCANVVYTDGMTSQLQDACILGVAVNKTNGSLCATIVNQTIKQNCVILTGGAAEEINCNQLNDTTDKQICEYNKAMSSNSTSDCMLISGATLQDNCLLQKAMRLGDQSICDMISSQTSRTVCLRNFGLE